jgi:hypothetical protein
MEKDPGLQEAAAALERDAEEVNEIEETGTEVDRIIQYSFYEEIGGEEIFRGRVSLYLNRDYFQARGDAGILENYFSESNIQELQL